MRVEEKIRDLKSIRILFIFDFVISLVLLISILKIDLLFPVTIIFSSLLIISITIQLVLYLFPKGVISFHSNGITIKSKTSEISFGWEKIKGIYYNSFSEVFPLLNHFTVELLISVDSGCGYIDFDKEYGYVKMYKKDYLKIISFIPKHVFENNEFIIYRNIIEKNTNKYNV